MTSRATRRSSRQQSHSTATDLSASEDIQPTSRQNRQSSRSSRTAPRRAASFSRTLNLELEVDVSPARGNKRSRRNGSRTQRIEEAVDESEESGMSHGARTFKSRETPQPRGSQATDSNVTPRAQRRVGRQSLILTTAMGLDERAKLVGRLAHDCLVILLHKGDHAAAKTAWDLVQAARQNYLFSIHAPAIVELDEFLASIDPATEFSYDLLTEAFNWSNLCNLMWAIRYPDGTSPLTQNSDVGSTPNAKAQSSATGEANRIKRRNELFILAWRKFWPVVVTKDLRMSDKALKLWLDFSTLISRSWQRRTLSSASLIDDSLPPIPDEILEDLFSPSAVPRYGQWSDGDDPAEFAHVQARWVSLVRRRQKALDEKKESILDRDYNWRNFGEDVCVFINQEREGEVPKIMNAPTAAARVEEVNQLEEPVSSDSESDKATVQLAGMNEEAVGDDEGAVSLDWIREEAKKEEAERVRVRSTMRSTVDDVLPSPQELGGSSSRQVNESQSQWNIKDGQSSSRATGGFFGGRPAREAESSRKFNFAKKQKDATRIDFESQSSPAKQEKRVWTDDEEEVLTPKPRSRTNGAKHVRLESSPIVSTKATPSHSTPAGAGPSFTATSGIFPSSEAGDEDQVMDDLSPNKGGNHTTPRQPNPTHNGDPGRSAYSAQRNTVPASQERLRSPSNRLDDYDNSYQPDNDNGWYDDGPQGPQDQWEDLEAGERMQNKLEQEELDELDSRDDGDISENAHQGDEAEEDAVKEEDGDEEETEEVEEIDSPPSQKKHQSSSKENRRRKASSSPPRPGPSKRPRTQLKSKAAEYADPTSTDEEEDRKKLERARARPPQPQPAKDDDDDNDDNEASVADSLVEERKAQSKAQSRSKSGAKPGKRGKRDPYVYDSEGNTIGHDDRYVIDPEDLPLPRSRLHEKEPGKSTWKRKRGLMHWSDAEALLFYRAFQKVPFSQPSPFQVVWYLHGEDGKYDDKLKYFHPSGHMNEKMKSILRVRQNNNMEINGNARRYLPADHELRKEYDAEKEAYNLEKEEEAERLHKEKADERRAEALAEKKAKAKMAETEGSEREDEAEEDDEEDDGSASEQPKNKKRKREDSDKSEKTKRKPKQKKKQVEEEVEITEDQVQHALAVAEVGEGEGDVPEKEVDKDKEDEAEKEGAENEDEAPINDRSRSNTHDSAGAPGPEAEAEPSSQQPPKSKTSKSISKGGNAQTTSKPATRMEEPVVEIPRQRQTRSTSKAPPPSQNKQGPKVTSTDEAVIEEEGETPKSPSTASPEVTVPAASAALIIRTPQKMVRSEKQEDNKFLEKPIKKMMRSTKPEGNSYLKKMEKTKDVEDEDVDETDQSKSGDEDVDEDEDEDEDEEEKSSDAEVEKLAATADQSQEVVNEALIRQAAMQAE